MARTATAERSIPIAPRRSLPRRLGSICRLARLPKPRQTPFTFWYLMVLAATTMVLRLVRPHTAHQLLAWSSTNVTELSRHPVAALVASALWLPGVVWAPYALAFTLVLAPVERVLGARRTILVFASGHLVATLATQLPVAVLIGFGGLGRSWADVIDVGVSYGLLSTGGVLLGMLVPRARWIGLLGAQLAMVTWLLLDPGVTSAGHLVALNVGLLWWPWLARRGRTGILHGLLPRPVPVVRPALGVRPVLVVSPAPVAGSAPVASPAQVVGSAPAATPAGTAGLRSATR